jgi:transcription elongation factor GreA
MNKQYLTQEKYDALLEEKRVLRKETIPGLAQRIDEARQMGDLSENAEYHAAREDMAWSQSRVKQIDAILENSEIITDQKGADFVDLGTTITVELNGNSREFSIVGAQEADPMTGRISNESPLGGAFMGKKKGDKVSVEVPAGTQEYKILKIN